MNFTKLLSFIICVFIFVIGCWSCTHIPYLPTETSSPYELKFSKLATMKSDKYGMGYTTDGEYLYAIYGRSRDRHFVTKSLRYSLATDEWSIFPNNKTTKRFVSAEYVGDKIYVLNGYNQDNSVNKKVEVIDPQTGEVSYLNDNPSPTILSGTAVWDDKIYMFGGSVDQRMLRKAAHTDYLSAERKIGTNIAYSDQMFVFDPVNDIWTPMGIIPEHKQTQGEIVDGVLYIFGGFNGQPSTQMDAYVIADSTWYYLGEMPIELSANAIAKHGEFIWLVGDYNKLSLLAVFNTKTLELHYIKSNIVGQRHACAVIVNNKLYIYGGIRKSSLIVADIAEVERLITQAFTKY